MRAIPAPVYDYLIVGSGFGGAVSALRLAEKGWRVGVVEQGRRIGSAEMRAAKRDLRHLMWLPRLGWRGYFEQRFLPHLAVLSGVGVGGGSLVWGAVMLEPKPAFYRSPALQRLGVDWEEELAAPFAAAKRRLGVVRNPRLTEQDAFLRATAERMGVGATFGPVPSAIWFGPEGPVADDPPAGGGRAPCCFCGGCLTGCEYGSKNSLDHNYLRDAEALGLTIWVERKVKRIEPADGGGYRVTCVSPVSGRRLETLEARRVVVSAGVVGTLELLFENRDRFRTLPRISPTLGKVVRTNSEAITAVLHPPGIDLTDGTAISSDFHPDAHTHATQNRFDRGYRFMRWMMAPMTDGSDRRLRAVRTLAGLVTRPGLMWRNWTAREWERRISVFTVMQDLENHVEVTFRQRMGGVFGLSTRADPGHAPPSYLPVANRLTRTFADLCGGEPLSGVMEAVAGVSTTAHVLSGCPMGTSSEDSVIDAWHQVHGHPGLYVVDGSSIPANIGVNPSLTIAAMAERFAARQPVSGRRGIRG